MSSSALVVLVPEAEELVAATRLRYDPSAAVGVPAHVTVLYPFVSPIDDDTVARVAVICRRHRPFRAEFRAVGRFPGEVVWLRPEPLERFSALLADAVAEFPEWPPYGGSIAEPVAHLTVADGVDAATASAVAAELERGLPVSSEIDELTLLLEDERGRWRRARSWPLGGGTTAMAAVQRELADDPTIDITTTGRRTGAARRVEIWMLALDGRCFITGTPGRRDWLANLLADPHLVVHLKRRAHLDIAGRATSVSDPDTRRHVLAHHDARWYRSQVPLDDLVAAAPMVEVTFDPPASTPP